MHCTKILETSIDLSDPNDIYTVDVVSLLFKHLKKRYTNKCFSSILIIDVIEILEYSSRKLVDNLLTGMASIDVRFKVTGVILVAGEILHGCQIIAISNTNTMIQHKYAVGFMTSDPKKRVLDVVKTNTFIPVIITKVKYTIYHDQIAISCVPYTPVLFNEPIYEIHDIISPEDTEKLDLIIKNINEELQMSEKLKKLPSYKFFTNIMYPYAKRKTLNPSFSPLTDISLKSILNMKKKLVSMLDYTSDDFIYTSDDNKNASEETLVVKANLYSALVDIFNKKLMYLVGLRGFIEYYDTPEKANELAGYFHVINSMKE